MSFLPTPIPHPLDNDIFSAPDWMQTAVEWVVGIEWPEGNEAAMRELADEWYAASDEIGPLLSDADAAALAAVAAFGGPEGQIAAAILELWSVLGNGEQAALSMVHQLLHGLGEWVDMGANEIEGVKIEFYVELGLLLIELIAIAAMAVFTAGAALGAAAPVMAASRFAIKMAIRKAAKKLLERALKKGLIDKFKDEIKDKVKSKVGRFLLDIADDAAEEALQEGLTSLGTQAYQVSEGDRQSLNWSDIRNSAALGALGGGVAGLASLGPGAKGLFGQFPEKMLRGAGGEILAEVTIGLVTGQGVDLKSLGMAASSGGFGSVTGVAQHSLDGRGFAALNTDFGSTGGLSSSGASTSLRDTGSGSGSFDFDTSGSATAGGGGSSGGTSLSAGASGGASWSGDSGSGGGSPSFSGTASASTTSSAAFPTGDPSGSSSTGGSSAGSTGSTALSGSTGVSTSNPAGATSFPDATSLASGYTTGYGPTASLEGVATADPVTGIGGQSSGSSSGQVGSGISGLTGSPNTVPSPANPAGGGPVVTAPAGPAGIVPTPGLGGISAPPATGSLAPAAAPGAPASTSPAAGSSTSPAQSGTPASRTPLAPTPASGSGRTPGQVSAPGSVSGSGPASGTGPAATMSAPLTTPRTGSTAIDSPGGPLPGTRRPAEPGSVQITDQSGQIAAAVAALGGPSSSPATPTAPRGGRPLLVDRTDQRGRYGTEVLHGVRERLRQRLELLVLTMRTNCQDRLDDLHWDIEAEHRRNADFSADHPDSIPDRTELEQLEAERDSERLRLRELTNDGIRALRPTDLDQIRHELWEIGQHDHQSHSIQLTYGGVIDVDTASQLTGVDQPPPVEASRRYGEPGGHRPPLALHQQDLELAVERDEEGRPRRFPNVFGRWLRLVNDSGPNADPSRGINCVDVVLSVLDTWMHGRPRVAAPRTVDSFSLDDRLNPIGGEPGGARRIEQATGGHFQQLMGDHRHTDGDTARVASLQGLQRLERSLLQAGPGSMAILIRESPGGSAHATTVHNQDGQIVHVDAQHPENPTSLHRPYGATRMDAIVIGSDGVPQDLGTPAGHWSAASQLPADTVDPQGLHRAESEPGVDPELMMRDATDEQLRELGVGSATLADLGYADLADVPPEQRAGIEAALPHTALIDPAKIRFTQRSVSPATSDGISAEELGSILRDKGWRGGPVHVVRFGDGSLASLDHRRLRAAQLAGLDRVPVVVHQPSDPIAAWPTEFPDKHLQRLRLAHDIHVSPDANQMPGRWVTDPARPVRTSPVHQAGSLPRTWGEFAVFRAADQRSLLPGNLFGTPTPPALIDKLPKPQSQVQIDRDERAALEALVKRAADAAQRTQDDLLTAAGGVDSSITPYGLGNRVKQFDSLARKYVDEARADNTPMADFAADVNDTLRFTLVMPDGDRYLPAVEQTLEAMRQRGYTVVDGSIKNFWVPGNRHYGVNATLVTPEGLSFEVQFPTELSLEMGSRTHEFYETVRRSGELPPRRIHALLRMISINKDLGVAEAIPPGVSAPYGAKPSGFADWIAQNPTPWREYQAWLDANQRTFDQIAAEFDLDRADFPISAKAQRGLTDGDVDLLRALPARPELAGRAPADGPGGGVPGPESGPGIPRDAMGSPGEDVGVRPGDRGADIRPADGRVRDGAALPDGRPGRSGADRAGDHRGPAATTDGAEPAGTVPQQRPPADPGGLLGRSGPPPGAGDGAGLPAEPSPESGFEPGPTAELAGRPEPADPSGLPGSDQPSARTLELAAQCRTPQGGVDPEGLARFIESVPRLAPTEPSGMPGALTEFTVAVLDRSDIRLHPLGSGPGKGQSGAPVFFVRDEAGDIVAVAKIFPRIDEMVRELSALERLGSREFTHFATPQAYGAAVVDLPSGPAGALIMSVAPGVSLFDIIDQIPRRRSPARDAAMDRVEAAVRDCARALAELHSRPAGSGGPVDPGFLEFNHGLAQRETAQVTAHRERLAQLGVDADELRSRVDAAIAAAFAEPGGAAIMHGDAHPGNLFWDPVHGVTLIDTPHAHFSIDDTGSAIGSPARDVANMVERLSHFSREAGIPWAGGARLQNAFLDTYRESGGPDIPDSAVRAFQTRFAMRDVLDTLTGLSGPGVTPAETAKLQAQLKDEIKLLRRALGWQS